MIKLQRTKTGITLGPNFRAFEALMSFWETDKLKSCKENNKHQKRGALSWNDVDNF